MIHAVIFDLDGLMIDSEQISLRVWRHFLAEYGTSLSESQYKTMIGMDAQASAAYVKGQSDLPLDANEIMRVHGARLMEFIGYEAITMPGLLDLIRELRERDMLLAVASNSPKNYVTRALGAIEGADLFNVVVTADQVQRGKPAPDIYLAAAAGLSCEPPHCLALEDSPLGLQAALSAGMRAVAVPNPDLEGATFEGAYASYVNLYNLRHDLDFLLN